MRQSTSLEMADGRRPRSLLRSGRHVRIRASRTGGYQPWMAILISALLGAVPLPSRVLGAQAATALVLRAIRPDCARRSRSLRRLAHGRPRGRHAGPVRALRRCARRADRRRRRCLARRCDGECAYDARAPADDARGGGGPVRLRAAPRRQQRPVEGRRGSDLDFALRALRAGRCVRCLVARLVHAPALRTRRDEMYRCDCRTQSHASCAHSAASLYPHHPRRAGVLQRQGCASPASSSSQSPRAATSTSVSATRARDARTPSLSIVPRSPTNSRMRLRAPTGCTLWPRATTPSAMRPPTRSAVFARMPPRRRAKHRRCRQCKE
jgi:hypothetical protein